MTNAMCLRAPFTDADALVAPTFAQSVYNRLIKACVAEEDFNDTEDPYAKAVIRGYLQAQNNTEMEALRKQVQSLEEDKQEMWKRLQLVEENMHKNMQKDKQDKQEMKDDIKKNADMLKSIATRDFTSYIHVKNKMVL